MGKTDEAMRNFQEARVIYCLCSLLFLGSQAMKHSPFMGKLLCSEDSMA